ncbi:hypothetical protein [Tautonia plasticadhaerens]|uniref:Translocation protein TolB n=1 Tax=Tautonia plasticadhaerens TaxID=2527974 RepID=A0A518GW31_9BACT|nr:hypothetical protein [Tautonia plasticadhaerens]QDV32751.1 hypothetical protein ElP_05910 [Tautonia plasticadhaerens]
MVRTVHSLIRIASIVGTLLVMFAIGLGRISPGPEGRSVAPALVVGVAPRFPGPKAGELRLLDIAEGAIRSVPIGSSDRIDLAVGSPWVDPWDQAHVVGRWASTDPDGNLRGAGLARLAYPSGRILDQISLDRCPTTAPCWGSGTSSRVLYVSGDGSMYRYDFEASAGEPGYEGQAGLHRVEWGPGVAGGDQPVLLDIGRPEGCLPPDMLLATAISRVPEEGEARGERSQIWWLRLDPDERTIVSCGQVTSKDPSARDVGRRRPALGRRPDGSLWLAYLSWNGMPDRMTLRLAPARLDERTGGPVAVGPGIPLARNCLSNPLNFTGGGTRLVCLTYEDEQPTALRITLDETPSPTALAVAGTYAGF